MAEECCELSGERDVRGVWGCSIENEGKTKCVGIAGVSRRVQTNGVAEDAVGGGG